MVDLEKTWGKLAYKAREDDVTFKVTVPAHLRSRFERFFALLHYNGGHSGIFGVFFDGDGNDSCHVTPAPPGSYAKQVGRIGGAGPAIELAWDNNYQAVYPDWDKGHYVVDDDHLDATFVPPDVEV